MACTGEIPAARYGHSACIIGSRMFIFGGKGEKGQTFKDVAFLDLLEWIWIPVSTLSEGPSPRMMHATEVVGRKIVIHGGWDGSEAFNDLWIFNTDSFAWMQPKTAGFGPTPKFGHTMNLLGDGRLLLFGGCNINKETGIPKYSNELRQLDTDSMVWTRPRITGAAPTSRYGHIAKLVNGKSLVICGGWGTLGVQTHEEINNPDAHTFHTLDVTTMSWSPVALAGRKPLRHLYNHAACLSGSTLFIHGGFDGQQASFDYFEVELLTGSTDSSGSPDL